MRGIMGFVSKELIKNHDVITQLKSVIGDQSVWWKGFEGDNVIAGCFNMGDRKSVLASNKRYACLFDGIIYNSEQIHALLENQGHSINDKDCAQLMMYSFSQWKEDCVYKIKGVFQAVVWDNEEKSLFIVCDRMGQKPFYYAQRGNLLAFASHYNMLLRYCGVEPVIDGTSIAEIIGLYPFKTSEFGMIKDVYKLRPAHYIKWSGGEVKIRRYWSIENRPHTDNLAITAQKVKFLVKDSVIQNVKHEENICSLLSGGVSSTANSAVAANYIAFLKGERIDTYSFDFKETDRAQHDSTAYQNSDKNWALRVSREFYTKHRHMLGNAQDILDTFDYLSAGGAVLNMPIYHGVYYEVFDVIGRHYRTLLSGTGADEVFWDGYSDEVSWEDVINERKAFLTPEMAFYADTKNYFAKKYEPESNKIIRADESEEDNKKRVHAYIMLNWKLFDELGAQTALADDNNLSVRFPLCDDKLIEYVWNIPYTMKTLGCRDKGIFRLAMKGILPDDVIARRKRTPPMPYTNWLNDMIKARIEAILNDSQSPIGRMISKDALNINELSMPNSSRKLPAIEFYAFLLQLNSWMDTFKIKIK